VRFILGRRRIVALAEKKRGRDQRWKWYREVSADGEVWGRRGLLDDGGEVAGEPVERLGLVVAEAHDEGLEQVERPGGEPLARARRWHHHEAVVLEAVLMLRLHPHGCGG